MRIQYVKFLLQLLPHPRLIRTHLINSPSHNTFHLSPRINGDVWHPRPLKFSAQKTLAIATLHPSTSQSIRTMPYSASTAFLEAIVEAGIKYIYGNFGSDHPGILESLAEAKKTGRKMPEVITCPIEQVGLHIAMGYAHVRSSEGLC